MPDDVKNPLCVCGPAISWNCMMQSNCMRACLEAGFAEFQWDLFPNRHA